MSDPRRATNTTGTRAGADRRNDGNATRRHDVSKAPIEPVVAVLDQGYDGGPGGCPADCRQRRKWTPIARSRALFIQSPTEAYCFNCGRTWTLYALRAHVLGDARLARRLERELEVTS